MDDAIPILLIPGLGGSPRIYGRDRAADPGRGATAFRAGRSFDGGYIAFEMMRQAPDRIVKLALIKHAALGR